MFLLISSGSSELNVNIVAVGYTGPNGYASLSSTGPAMSVAVDEVRHKYAGIINISLTVVYDKAHENCAMFADDAEYLVARWFYQNLEQNRRAVPVLILPGLSSVITENHKQLESDMSPQVPH